MKFITKGILGVTILNNGVIILLSTIQEFWINWNNLQFEWDYNFVINDENLELKENKDLIQNQIYIKCMSLLSIRT